MPFFKRNLLFLFAFLFVGIGCKQAQNDIDTRFVSTIVDPQKQNVQMFLKDESGQNFKSIQNLKSWLEARNKTLEFAMNGGMYRPDHSPQGLYIENFKTLSPIDTASGGGNFYLKQNGVFYLTKNNIPHIATTQSFKSDSSIQFATQSGPMLLIDGTIHPAFKKGSANLNVRNGVGILPDNTILFAMSKSEINFYDFAEFFKKVGCRNALYLDGLVSRTYLPQKSWVQADGDFGVIIAVVK